MRQRQLVLALLAGFALSCTQHEPGHTATGGSPTSGTTEHGSFRPEQVEWKDGPPSLPAGAKFAVLEGDPAKEGYFAMRAKLPDGYRVPPHWHPGVERVTVLSGTFHLGMGETFDPTAAHQTLPAGSYVFMPPGMRHFAWTSGETVIQITTNGPWGINYVRPEDDPRRQPKK